MKRHTLLQISSFSVIRRENNNWILEQMLSGFRIIIRKHSVLKLLFSFTKPINPKELIEEQPLVLQHSLERLIDLLCKKKVLVSPEKHHSQKSKSIDFWQFHDLVFHTQSRQGLHFSPLGATYRFGHSPNPEGHHRKRKWKGKKISFPKIDLCKEEFGFNFYELLEERKTSYVASSLTQKDLGSFLTHSLRSKTPQSDYLKKLYPSGGGMHSIETYLAIYNFSDLEPGLYYYDCNKHGLTLIPEQETLADSILRNAQEGMGKNIVPSAIMIFTSRFERVFWKYESIGYRLILIELGAIFQTLYLAAASLGLSVCALGRGNSSEFSESLNLDYFKETSIGEFIINGKI
jgi:oxazoline/thiazoline dehydrogenase